MTYLSPSNLSAKICSFFFSVRKTMHNSFFKLFVCPFLKQNSLSMIKYLEEKDNRLNFYVNLFYFKENYSKFI